jgi:hypothetical protein
MMAGYGQQAGHGSGDAHDHRATYGEPAAPAEPPALCDDLIDIQALPCGPGRRLLHPERAPERVEIGHGSITARQGRGGLVGIGIGRHPELGQRA